MDQGVQELRVLEAQQPWLDHLDSWDAWRHWRDAVIAYHRGCTHLYCSISALVNEVAATDAGLAAEVAAHADDWHARLRAACAGCTRPACSGRTPTPTGWRRRPSPLQMAIYAW